jgi:hypothetical protein
MKQSRIRAMNKRNWMRTMENVNGETCPALKRTLRDMLTLDVNVKSEARNNVKED